MVKFLVAARTDVSKLTVTDDRMNEFASALGFEKTFRTSAATGKGVAQLLEEVKRRIRWEELPETVSEQMFKQMKDFVVAQRAAGEALTTCTDLTRKFRLEYPDAQFQDDRFRTALLRVEAHDLVKTLSFGDYVLLQPEVLDNYAVAMAMAARDQPDGLGFIEEQKARECRFDTGSLERLTNGRHERIILQAAVEMFIEKDLAIADDGELIFPSQFNRELPVCPAVTGTTVTYKFEGAVVNVYTTLVVRLYHSEPFEMDSLYKNAAIFLPFGLRGEANRCGFRLEDTGMGEASLTVFFGKNVEDATKVLFLKYIHEHLRRTALDGLVARERIYRCPKPRCGEEVVNRRAVDHHLERGSRHIRCDFCDAKILLRDLIEETFGKDDKFMAQVRNMDSQINETLSNERKEQILIGRIMELAGQAGQVFRPTSMFDWGIDGEIEFTNDREQPCGERIYLQLKSGASHLRERKDAKRTFQIPKERHIDYWQQQGYPVYLVVLDKDDKMYWINITEKLKRQEKRSTTIVFDGEELTKHSLLKVRESVIRKQRRQPQTD